LLLLLLPFLLASSPSIVNAARGAGREELYTRVSLCRRAAELRACLLAGFFMAAFFCEERFILII
jgi:hypothetical protein